MTRISADDPTAVQAVPAELRGILDYCKHCPTPDRLDLYAPEQIVSSQPQRLALSYVCRNGHRWTRGYANDPAPSSAKDARPPGLIGYLEHDDPDRHNSLGIWCVHCCAWHVHRVSSMAPDRAVQLIAGCSLRGSPYRRTGYQVWSGDTPLAVARAVRRDATPAEHALIRTGQTTDAIEQMRDSRISGPITDITQDGVGWDCDATDPSTGRRGTTAASRPILEKPCALYWHYDAAGVLLYIGISMDLVTRGRTHASSSVWVVFAKSSRSVWCSSRAEALEDEEAAIKAERPVFNRKHNDTPEARARLVAYLLEHGRPDLLELAGD
jgi:hypothetical protein